jgi:small GTP-binding protein
MKAKVVLVGAAHTGKTSIVNRYIYGEFSPHTMPSTQPAFFQKRVNYMRTDLMLEIWDTAGQEQYHSLSPMFYRDADAGIVVFDVTDSSSFAKAKTWVNELRDARGESITIVVVGNKCDLASAPTVSLESTAGFALTIHAESFETSAKSGENIELLFNSLVMKLSTKGPSALPDGTQGKKCRALPFDEAPRRHSECC